MFHLQEVPQLPTGRRGGRTPPSADHEQEQQGTEGLAVSARRQRASFVPATDHDIRLRELYHSSHTLHTSRPKPWELPFAFSSSTILCTRPGTVNRVLRRPPQPERLEADLTVTFTTKFIRGDVNGDDHVDVADAVWILSELFRGGRHTSCRKAGDANDDGMYNIGDAVAVLSFFFSGTGPLLSPFGPCGGDPTPDDLDCASHSSCR